MSGTTLDGDLIFHRMRSSKNLASAPCRGSARTLRVNLDVKLDVIVDKVRAKVAEEFPGAVLAAIGGAVEGEDALAGEVTGVVFRGDDGGEFHP